MSSDSTNLLYISTYLWIQEENIVTALTIGVLGHLFDLRDVTMFGPLLARAVTPMFWIYMSPKLRAILAKLVGQRS